MSETGRRLPFVVRYAVEGVLLGMLLPALGTLLLNRRLSRCPPDSRHTGVSSAPGTVCCSKTSRVM